MFKGVAICPLVKLPLNTSAPSTWYVKILAKSGEANNCAAVRFNAVSAFAKAVLVGAKTVSSAKGLVKAGNNSAVTTAVVNVEKLA